MHHFNARIEFFSGLKIPTEIIILLIEGNLSSSIYWASCGIIFWGKHLAIINCTI